MKSLLNWLQKLTTIPYKESSAISLGSLIAKHVKKEVSRDKEPFTWLEI